VTLLGGAALADAPADVPRTGATTTVTTEATTPTGRPKFYGVSFDVSVADGSGLNAVGHSYRNELSFYFEPKWNVGQMWFKDTRFASLQVAGRFALTQALSGTDPSSFGSVANAGPETPCSNLTVGNGGTVDPNQVGLCNPQANSRRLDYSDIWLTVRNPAIYTIPRVNVAVSPSVRFYIPTSAESQYQSLELAMSPAVNLGRSFYQDKVHTAVGLGWTKYFDRYTTPGLQADQSGTATAQGNNPYDGLQGVGLSNFFNDPSRVGTVGGFNTSYSWTGTLDVGYDFNDRLSLDVLYLYVYAQPYGHACVVDVGNGVTQDTCAAGDAVAANEGSTLARPGHHDSEVFWATLSYRLRDWLSLNVAWITWSPAQYPDGSFRQPFISTNYDAFTTVQVGTTVSLDKLAAKRF
jgi:hypothetical protein